MSSVIQIHSTLSRVLFNSDRFCLTKCFNLQSQPTALSRSPSRFFLAQFNSMQEPSLIASSECGEGDLWGSDDEDGVDPSIPASAGLHDEDPTSSILNLPPDESPRSLHSTLPSTTFRRHPPAFQGAFSQARVQQPMMRSFTDAFNHCLPSLFNSPPALPAHGSGSETGSVTPLADEMDFSQLSHNHQSTSGTHDEYPEAFEDAAARFLEDFVAGDALLESDEAQDDDNLASASFDPCLATGDSTLGDQTDDALEETLAQFARSLTDSPVELRNVPTSSAAQWPSNHVSTSASQPTMTTASNRNLPTTDTNPSRPKPAGLFLPPRAPRLANDCRYSQTPFNSPITSGPSTPVPSVQPLPRVSRPPRAATSYGKTAATGMLSSSRKRKATAPPPPPPPSAAARRLSTIHDTLMRASAGDVRVGTAERRAVSGLPRRSEIEQVRLFKQIRELRKSRGSSTTIEQLEKQWDALLRRSDGL